MLYCTCACTCIYLGTKIYFGMISKKGKQVVASFKSCNGDCSVLIMALGIWVSSSIQQHLGSLSFIPRSEKVNQDCNVNLASFPGPAHSLLAVRNSCRGPELVHLREFCTASDERTGPGNKANVNYCAI